MIDQAAADRPNRSPSSPADRRGAGTWLGLQSDTLVPLVLIAVLLVTLPAISQPADADPTRKGGFLARERVRFGLSQANLGEIDPASETMRLATLGLKNVAVTMLWDRANHYKKVEDWTSLSATFEQMVKLQPNFFSIWDYQAHNLSYNISVEFDDYHDRYDWVMKGIEFLRQGIALNAYEPRLLGRMGWFIGQKIGKSDEKVQFRRLFKKDEEFHKRDRLNRTLSERDNWLVAREKYIAGRELADSGAPLRTTPLIFHSEPMMTAINYAKAMEQEGTFGDAARDAWRLAGDEMRRFAVREIPTSWDVPILLGMREAEETRAAGIAKRLESLMPGLMEATRKQRQESLSDDQRKAIATPAIERTERQMVLAGEAESILNVTWPMIVKDAPAEVRNDARQLVKEYVEAKEKADIIARYREIVNFDFWRATCEAEVTEPALRAREATWRAEREYENARLQTAKKAFEEAFTAWREVLDASPVLRGDDLTAEDLADVVRKYRKVLDQLDEPFPQPFILQDMLDLAPPGSG